MANTTSPMTSSPITNNPTTIQHTNTSVPTTITPLHPYVPWSVLIEPGTYFLLLCVLLIIQYGSWRCRSVASTSNGAMEGTENINWIMVVLIPVMLSLLLVVLFYALSSLWILIFIVVGIVSIGSVVLVTWPLYGFVAMYINRLFKSSVIEDYGGLSLSVLTAVGLGIAWIVTGHWIVLDILATATIITILTYIRIPTLSLGITLLCVMLVYDVVWTFLSPILFGESVMEHVAKQVAGGWVTLPIVIAVPHIWSNGASILGLGDVLVPGLFIVFLLRWDGHNRHMPWEGTARCGYLGYVLGYLLTFFILVVSDRGQPALLYIVPCVLTASLGYSYIKTELNELRNYSTENSIMDLPDASEATNIL